MIRCNFAKTAVNFCVFCIILFAAHHCCASAISEAHNKKIVSIIFNGNRITKEKTLKMFMQLDTAMVFDSTKIAWSKQHLLATDLFSKVDIIPLVKDDGVHLYIIVKELFYFIPDFGGERYERKYGENEVWYHVNAGITQNNFGGRLETISFRASLWDERSLSVSWNKQLLPSAYSIGLSAGTGYCPDLNFPLNRFYTSGKISLSRKLGLNEQCFIGLTPSYNRIDSINCKTEHSFKELISSIGIASDHRNDNFSTTNGWYAYEEISNNALYSGDAFKYGQFNSLVLWYIPSFIEKQFFAFRVQSIFRTNKASVYKRLYLGGENSVRGFSSGTLGIEDTMNNSFAISSEYRFPLWQTPILYYPFISDKVDELKGLYYNFDGALIADFGHLWNSFSQPFEKRQNGGGIGLGIKIKAPTLRVSGSIDAVFPILKDPRYGKVEISEEPQWHLYFSNF